MLAQAFCGLRYVATGDDIPAGHDVSEDERYSHHLWEDHLKTWGQWCEFNIAKDGTTSPTEISGGQLAQTWNYRPDLITLDLVMPLMAGWQVLDQLKSDPELASIPVVMVTIVDHDAIGLLSAGAPSLITSADRDGLAAVLNRHDQSPVDEVTFAYNGVQ